MDAETIQSKIYTGYGKAALRVGYLFNQFRPSGPLYPLSLANQVGQINASFVVGPSGFNFNRAVSYKDVTFNGLFDATDVEVGDYLVSTIDETTYFVASLQPLVPPLCVKCNRVLNISAPGPSPTFGAQTTYQGTDPATETALMSGWPASLMFDARGRAQEVGLPLDLPSPYFTILLPALAAVDVRSSIQIADDLGRNYDVAAAERSALGWRLFAQQQTT